MKKLILVSLTLLCVSNLGFAFDNKRSGFIIGGLGGVGVVIWNQSVNGFESDTETDIAVHVDFRIGGGFAGDRVMLYYWGAVNAFTMENVLGDEVVIGCGFNGLGLSYYFKPTSPSFYVNTGLGVSLWNALSEPEAGYWWGFGLMAGIGYEFSTHWSTEFGIMWGNPSTEELGIKLQTNAFALTLSIIGIAY